MAGTGQAVEIVIAERLTASPIRQTGSASHWVVGVGGLVDLGRGGRELMEDLGDLTGGIV